MTDEEIFGISWSAAHSAAGACCGRAIAAVGSWKSAFVFLGECALQGAIEMVAGVEAR